MKPTEVECGAETVLGKLIRSMGPFGFVAVDQERVNIDDLCEPSQPGKIVRVFGDPATAIVFFAPPDAETLGCVAGWISDSA